MVVAIVMINFFGPECDKTCIDSSCSIYCACNDAEICSGVKNICNNDITITGQNITLNSLSNYFIQGNISISNSSVSFNLNSSLISTGCINISNSYFKIDLSNFTFSSTSNEDKIYLINSTAGCLYGDTFSLSYLNQPKCTILKNEMDSYSLFIIFVKQTESECATKESQNTITWWEITIIVVGSVVGVALIFIVLVLAIPALRNQIFPHKDKRKRRKERNEEIGDKLEDLKSEIKDVQDQHQKLKDLINEDN